MIEGLYSIRIYSTEGKRSFEWNTDPENPKTKLPDTIDSKGFYLSTEQMNQLKKIGFTEKKANYTNYSKGRVNDITVDENLENVTGSEFVTKQYLIFDKQNENSVRQAYTAIALSLLRINAEGIRLGSAPNSSLQDIEKKYVNDIEKAINKDNKNLYGLSGAVGYRIAQSILNSIRTSIATQFLLKFANTDKAIGAEEESKAFEKAEEAAKNNEDIVGSDIDSDELSEKDIKAKQKFLKQCLLMSASLLLSASFQIRCGQTL